MDVSVLVGTYNRSRLLASTLDGLAAMQVRAGLTWEVIIVDNNSTDGTRAVVEARGRNFPVRLRYLFEPRQGKSHALNSGIAASSATIIVFTDDDVRVDAQWLEAGVRPLLERTDIDYTGGPALPMWEVPPPRWLQGASGVIRGPIATLDYGPEAFILEDKRRIAMGVNMAVRRTVFQRVGGFNPDLDRQGASLLGQGQAEFFFRTRMAGIRGLYVPAMVVEHHVPASRMHRGYHRRWWYWKGVARARLHLLHPISELGIDQRAAPQFLRTPRFMWGSAVSDARRWLSALVRRDTTQRIERELMLVYFAGYLAERLRTRQPPRAMAGPGLPGHSGPDADLVSSDPRTALDAPAIPGARSVSDKDVAAL